GNGHPVERHGIHLELHPARHAHAERLPDGLLHTVGSEADDGDLTLVLLGEPEGQLDGVPVEVADVELEAGLVERLPIGGNGKAHFGIGDALDADGDLQRLLLVEIRRTHSLQLAKTRETETAKAQRWRKRERTDPESRRPLRFLPFQVFASPTAAPRPSPDGPRWPGATPRSSRGSHRRTHS